MAGRKQRGTLALTAGVAIIMAVLFANAVISYQNTQQLVSNNAWVQHTFQVISELELTLSLLKDVETGQRGYLITHDSVYLEPYQQAMSEIGGHVDRVATLTGDNEIQQHRIPQLRQLVAERLNIARENIDLEQNGKHAEAVGSVISQAGKSKMDQVRDLAREHHPKILWCGTTA